MRLSVNRTVAIAGLWLMAMGPMEPVGNPAELGRVRWGRDLDAGLRLAAETGKPVLVLFQEIPGCQTCRGFGREPLSHPLLVEAIETEFVPVAIYNNREGRDAEVLKRYDEPSWNNPVMRFVDARGDDVLPRRDRVWSTGDVSSRLVEALQASGRPVPAYLALAAAESADKPTRQAVFSMHCFWEGEAGLGALDGVLGTRAGWIGGAEVVDITFDPAVISVQELQSRARQLRCTAIEGTVRDAEPADRKFALNQSELRYLPLTPMQATRVNADIHAGADPTARLSPRQIQLLETIRAVLETDPDALSALSRPENLTDLAAYRDKLTETLAKEHRASLPD